MFFYYQLGILGNWSPRTSEDNPTVTVTGHRPNIRGLVEFFPDPGAKKSTLLQDLMARYPLDPGPLESVAAVIDLDDRVWLHRQTGARWAHGEPAPSDYVEYARVVSGAAPAAEAE
ncbi:MAG: hypothetical protein ACRCYS_13805, partial [Beijerinckiaceae bacterium]